MTLTLVLNSVKVENHQHQWQQELLSPRPRQQHRSVSSVVVSLFSPAAAAAVTTPLT